MWHCQKKCWNPNLLIFPIFILGKQEKQCDTNSKSHPRQSLRGFTGQSFFYKLRFNSARTSEFLALTLLFPTNTNSEHLQKLLACVYVWGVDFIVLFLVYCCSGTKPNKSHKPRPGEHWSSGRQAVDFGHEQDVVIDMGGEQKEHVAKEVGVFILVVTGKVVPIFNLQVIALHFW